LLTGKPPYGATQTVAQLLAHQKEPVPDIRSVLPDVPAGLAAVMARMMAKDKNDRFGDYDELLEALDTALSDGEVPAAPRWRPWALGGLLAGAALMLGIQEWPVPSENGVAENAVNHAETVTLPPPPDVVAVMPQPEAPVVTKEEPPAPPPEPVKEDPVARLLSDVETAKGAPRSAAMRSLARSHDARARPALEAVVVNNKDEDAPLAALLLGELGDQAATDALVKSLASPRRATVLAAVDALSLLRDVRAVEPLRALSTSHADATVRSRAARAGTLLFAVEKEP